MHWCAAACSLVRYVYDAIRGYLDAIRQHLR
jgi:hypothetical protein